MAIVVQLTVIGQFAQADSADVKLEPRLDFLQVYVHLIGHLVVRALLLCGKAHRQMFDAAQQYRLDAFDTM